MDRVGKDYFYQDALVVAESLLGKKIVRVFETKEIHEYVITETEAYVGEEDLACHASKGRTKRTEILYHDGGKIYVYLIYGKYWMLNFVTGKTEHPQAVLIRSVQDCIGPGRLGRKLQLDHSFYGEDIYNSKRIWVENYKSFKNIKKTPRIGIDYAEEPWKSICWRFTI